MRVKRLRCSSAASRRGIEANALKYSTFSGETYTDHQDPATPTLGYRLAEMVRQLGDRDGICQDSRHHLFEPAIDKGTKTLTAADIVD